MFCVIQMLRPGKEKESFEWSPSHKCHLQNREFSKWMFFLSLFRFSGGYSFYISVYVYIYNNNSNDNN